MDQAGIVTIIDEALERFACRDLLGSRGPRLLLDLRTAVVSDAALAALIESETAARALSHLTRVESTASRRRSRRGPAPIPPETSMTIRRRGI